MSTSETRYTFQVRVPPTFEVGRDQRTTLAAYLSGALVTPASGTYSLVDDGDTVVASGPVDVTSGVASFTIDAADIPTTLALGTQYQERWSLVMPDGTTRNVRRTAAFALFELHPMVADDDVLRIYPDLIDSLGDYATSLQGWSDDAWDAIRRHLWRHNDFPFIVVEPSDLFGWLQHETLVRVFRALISSSPNDERWMTLKQDHMDLAEAAKTGLTIRVDRDLDGHADDNGRHAVGARTIAWHAPEHADPRVLPSKFR